LVPPQTLTITVLVPLDAGIMLQHDRHAAGSCTLSATFG